MRFSLHLRQSCLLLFTLRRRSQTFLLKLVRNFLLHLLTISTETDLFSGVTCISWKQSILLLLRTSKLLRKVLRISAARCLWARIACITWKNSVLLLLKVSDYSPYSLTSSKANWQSEATSHSINKMSGTDSSNDILLPDGKFAVNRGWVPKPQSIGLSDESTWSNQQCGSSNPKHGRSDSEKLGLGGVGVNPGRASVDVGPSQGGKAGNVKKDAEATSFEEELKELETLKNQILFNAHTRRHTYDTHSINLKFLAQVRDGPGTDSNSDVYRELMRRAAPYGISSSFQSSAGAQSASGQFNGSQEGALAKTHDSLRAAYSKSPTIYPVVENGQLLLSSEPTPEVLVYVRAIGKEFSLAVDDADLKEADQAAELKWGNTYYANWEYRPQVCSNFAAFRDWFRRWLDTTAQICCQHDVYHPAFFDGTAHPDGIKSFMFPDVDHPTTHLDMSHEETRLHAHETAEGYCHNWALQIKREEEEKRAQKVRAQAQAAHYQSLRNNSAANSQGLNPYYYIRPVELDDIPELVEVMNLAIEGGSMTLRVAPVEEHDVRERIEIAKRQMLPFLVVAERRFARHDPGDGQPRGIIGYALATEAGSDLTAARFTAELEIFIRQGHRSRGIGRCLMDKLMDVCDPTFKIRGGYFFYSSWEDNPGYVSGGRRRLSRLLFIISVPTAQLESLKWLQGWFEREFGFKQQGVLNGVRFKFNQL